MKTHYAASVCSTSIKDLNLDNSKGRLCLLVVFLFNQAKMGPPASLNKSDGEPPREEGQPRPPDLCKVIISKR